LATEKQMAANRRNAAKSTGPRTAAGKARSRMNAHRHGFASAVQVTTANNSIPKQLAAELYEGLNRVHLARSNLIGKIHGLLQQPPSEDLHKTVQRLGALQRHSARYFQGNQKSLKEIAIAGGLNEIFCRTKPIFSILRSLPVRTVRQ
jgi:hypothetical protein